MIKTVEAYQILNDDDSQEKHSLIYLTATDRADLIVAIEQALHLPRVAMSARAPRLRANLQVLRAK